MTKEDLQFQHLSKRYWQGVARMHKASTLEGAEFFLIRSMCWGQSKNRNAWSLNTRNLQTIQTTSPEG